MINKTLATTEKKMQSSLEGLKTDHGTIRTGRASPDLVSHLKIDYAGAVLPLNQLAGISVPEARSIIIQPWDKASISAITKAIQKSELGLNPSSDGSSIRLTLPPLSEERRLEMVKLVHKRLEERKVVLRRIREDAKKEITTLEKSKEISQDESRRAQDQLQKLTDKSILGADKIAKDKETELEEV